MQKPYEDSPQMIEHAKKGTLCGEIFVGGLSSSITEKKLRNYFSQFGEVSKCQVCRSYNGKSKGFGFLSFCHSSARDAALGRLHHLNGQRLNIESVLARPQKSLRVASKHTRKIQVNNLPCWASKADIFECLSSYGAVQAVTRAKENRNGALYCFAVLKDDQTASDLVQHERIPFPPDWYLIIKPFTPQSWVPAYQPKNSWGWSEEKHPSSQQLSMIGTGELRQCYRENASTPSKRLENHSSQDNFLTGKQSIQHDTEDVPSLPKVVAGSGPCLNLLQAGSTKSAIYENSEYRFNVNVNLAVYPRNTPSQGKLVSQSASGQQASGTNLILSFSDCLTK